MMWQDLLGNEPNALIAPWIGKDRIFDPCSVRSFKLADAPQEHGWYRFEIRGRTVVPIAPTDERPTLSRLWVKGGYLLGNRLAVDAPAPHERSRYCPAPIRAPAEDLALSPYVHLVEPGEEMFASVATMVTADVQHVYLRRNMPTSVERVVRRAFQDGKSSVDDIPHVTPALASAFAVAVRMRCRVEERRTRIAREREQTETWNAMYRRSLKIHGRQSQLSSLDLQTAASMALAMGGAELIEVRLGAQAPEAIVTFRLTGRRFQCIVDQTTLCIIDAGVCLTDERTHEKGDALFTLESLPGVILEAISLDKLVVFRHV